MSEIDKLRNLIKALQNASQVLMNLSRQPVPKDVPAKEQGEAQKYNQWLQQASSKLKAAADKGEGALKKAQQGSGKDPHQTQELNSVVSQAIQVTNQVQDENRRFALVSNIMKTKHDTAKNAINNVR